MCARDHGATPGSTYDKAYGRQTMWVALGLCIWMRSEAAFLLTSFP